MSSIIARRIALLFVLVTPIRSVPTTTVGLAPPPRMSGSSPAMGRITAASVRQMLPTMNGPPTQELGDIHCQNGYGKNGPGKVHEESLRRPTSPAR